MRPARFSLAAIGKARTMVGWRKEREKRRAKKQEDDVHTLDREGDPRGGVQSDEYRNADPRDVVVDEDVAMSGPAGAPQEDADPEGRRRTDRT
jgi:hypothetical protein